MPRDLSKKYATVRLPRKLKKRWEQVKAHLSYGAHLTKLLNSQVNSPKITTTLDNHLEILCPVLIRLEETCYCALKPPRAAKLLTLQLCLVCQSMKKYDHVLDLMRDGYTETIIYPICGGDERLSRGKHWIKCPKSGHAEKLYPNWCKNRDCKKLKKKDIVITLEGLTTKEAPNL